METSKILIPIKVSDIYPHPDNPRKNIGNIEEMIDSVKKNGIMQNLSVIPGHYEDRELVEGGYTLIIGHRRFEAAKRAGLTEVPCRIIKDTTLKEQVGIMLEENMQRNDLTIIEQAEGFQMMLDLGETEESIAEKTGFSKQTVKHRVNLAKLDRNLLKAKEENHQLTLKDLYELEKIKDIDKRNEILEIAEDSNDISWEVSRALREEMAAEQETIVMGLIVAAGYQEAPEKTMNELYGEKWKRYATINLEEDNKSLDLSQYPANCKWIKSRWRNEILIIQEQEVKEKKLTDYEKKRMQEEEDRKALRNITSKLHKKLSELAKMILENDIEVKEDLETYKLICKALLNNGISINLHTESQLLYGKPLYELKQNEEDYKDYKKLISRVSEAKRMLAHILHNTYFDTFNWNLEYNKANAEHMSDVILIAERYGMSIDDEEEQLLGGTHPAYRKKD